MSAPITESKLFTPLKVGTMSLSHRVVMAPMTRLRTNSAFAPLKVVKEYYSQRSGTPGTFIISEGTIIGPSAAGFPGAPGVWSDEQLSAWKEIVDAVHAKGSYIFLQIAAIGRVADPAVLRALDESFDVVGAGDIRMAAGDVLPAGVVPRPMTIEEIKESVELFTKAASNAVHRAGFDGIEIHGANGFLFDQFLQDGSNNRKDQYGGSIENRTRYAMEVIGAISKAIGEERTAVRLSPWNRDQDMGMKDPIPTFAYLVSRLRDTHPNLAYLHLVQSRRLEDPRETNEELYNIWSPRPLVIADGFTREKALKAAEREGVLVAFGRQFISNPDLPLRLKLDKPLSAYNRETFYGGDESGKGYTDYAFSSN